MEQLLEQCTSEQLERAILNLVLVKFDRMDIIKNVLTDHAEEFVDTYQFMSDLSDMANELLIRKQNEKE